VTRMLEAPDKAPESLVGLVISAGVLDSARGEAMVVRRNQATRDVA